MLCCVSKRAVEGADQGSPYDEYSEKGGLLPSSSLSAVLERIEIELFPEEDASSADLLPCSICSRTFLPESLEKHKKVCERAMSKKRKPFDSAKQRIQGTDLAEYLPKQDKKRHHSVDDRSTCKNRSSWKDTHDDLLRTIRTARGDTIDQSVQRQMCTSLVSTGAPTRANEKGLCPTCNRHFGIKAYDRHVAWCKEKSTRVQTSPAQNVAKERFEARMRYRAPVLKNRRTVIRDKYSSAGGGGNIGTSSLSAVNRKPSINSVQQQQESVKATKENASSPSFPMLPSCNNKATAVNKDNESPVKQKPAVVRRPSQIRDSPISQSNSNPTKSRLMDRISSGSWKDYDPFLLAEQQMHDLLSDTSDQSNPLDGARLSTKTTPDTELFPLSHSSAFVKYPNLSPILPSNGIAATPTTTAPTTNNSKRGSVIAPPTEFDDLISDFSSDSTETNSLSREIYLETKPDNQNNTSTNRTSNRELGRRVIIDKSKALGILEEQKKNKVSRPTTVTRSNSIRASSAPKPSTPVSEKKTKQKIVNRNNSINRNKNNNNNNNHHHFTGSNFSLNSIISSEMSSTDMMKRSNSVFDELISSFEEYDGGSGGSSGSTLSPSLSSFFKNDSLSISSPASRHKINHHDPRAISDEEFSSPDSFNPSHQDHGKMMSADSAYSSLNRKYSVHGRSTNDVVTTVTPGVGSGNGMKGEDSSCKMSNFCHQCGCKFLEAAKFCCQCGVKRLAIQNFE